MEKGKKKFTKIHRKKGLRNFYKLGAVSGKFHASYLAKKTRIHKK